MVVAGDDQHAAMRRGAVGVAVLQRVAGAVDARALAVPEAEDAFDGPVRIALDLLRAQHRGRGQVLVDGRQELDPVLGEERRHPPGFEIDAAERRAAIAGDEAGRVEPGLPVAPRLVEHARISACVPVRRPGPLRRVVAVCQRVPVVGGRNTKIGGYSLKAQSDPPRIR